MVRRKIHAGARLSRAVCRYRLDEIPSRGGPEGGYGHLGGRGRFERMRIQERPNTGLKRRRMFVAVLAALGAAVGIAAAVAAGAPSINWSMSGQGITNWRYQPDESQ